MREQEPALPGPVRDFRSQASIGLRPESRRFSSPAAVTLAAPNVFCMHRTQSDAHNGKCHDSATGFHIHGPDVGENPRIPPTMGYFRVEITSEPEGQFVAETNK